MPRREIYFHEDDYRQQQLLPVKMTESAQVEMPRSKLDTIAERLRH